jgi:hypothetical protein
MIGGFVYPDPALVTVMYWIVPPETTAVPAPAVPATATIVIVGALVYPDPPEIRFTVVSFPG